MFALDLSYLWCLSFCLRFQAHARIYVSNFSSDFNCRPASKLSACILRNLADQKVGFRKLGDGRLFRLRDNVRTVLRRKLQSKTAVAALKTHVPFIGASMKR